MKNLMTASEAEADELVTKLAREALETFGAVVIIGVRVEGAEVGAYVESQCRDGENAGPLGRAILNQCVSVAGVIAGHLSGDDPLPQEGPERGQA